MDLREVGWGGGIDWINLGQDRDRWRALVYTVMNLRVPGRTLLQGVSLQPVRAGRDNHVGVATRWTGRGSNPADTSCRAV